MCTSTLHTIIIIHIECSQYLVNVCKVGAYISTGDILRPVDTAAVNIYLISNFFHVTILTIYNYDFHRFFYVEFEFVIKIINKILHHIRSTRYFNLKMPEISLFGIFGILEYLRNLMEQF